MFFGLTNSPATFQMMMNEIYKGVIEKHEKLGTTIRVYMDDIRIATRTNLLDHTNVVKDVLKVAMNYDLYFKQEKCTFHSPSLDYLGVILEKGVTRMDPVKISSIKDWPTPTKVRDVQSFLGFCNFYHLFIKGFAAIAKLLNELTKKTVEWTWGPTQQKVFDTLKHQVTSEPVLAHPVLQDQF